MQLALEQTAHRFSVNNNFCIFFWKTTPYGKILKILFRKFTWRHRFMLLRSNVVKHFPTENRWNRALFTSQKNKIKFRLPLELSLLHGSRPKTATARPNIYLTIFQISSKSVHFRRSYSRTREGRSFDLKRGHWISCDIAIFTQVLAFTKWKDPESADNRLW